jgi:FtsZ-interacting cell division protein ZipA
MREKNKSHKIRLILGVLIGLSFVSVIFFSLYNRQNIKISNKDKKTDAINETNNNQSNETLIEEVKEKDSNESIESNNNPTSKSEQKVEVKNETPKSETKQEEKQTSSQIPKVDTNTKNDINAWDELGITENEYYNSPAWSWARVDFAIEKYGSQEKCLNACIEYGESTGMGYSCSTINSYSGRYLGEMLKLF